VKKASILILLLFTVLLVGCSGENDNDNGLNSGSREYADLEENLVITNSKIRFQNSYNAYGNANIENKNNYKLEVRFEYKIQFFATQKNADSSGGFIKSGELLWYNNTRLYETITIFPNSSDMLTSGGMSLDNEGTIKWSVDNGYASTKFTVLILDIKILD
jgi:hypothetical protein